MPVDLEEQPGASRRALPESRREIQVLDPQPIEGFAQGPFGIRHGRIRER